MQDLMIKQNINVTQLAVEINMKPGKIWGWFQTNRIPKKYLKLLSERFNVEEEYIDKIVNDINTYAPRYKGFNDYKIIEEITEIYVTKRNGEKYTVLIDTEDLSKLIELGYRWHLFYDPVTEDHYVHTTYYRKDENGDYLKDENGKRLAQTGVLLHSIIMNTRNIVDHIDHKSLDNRKSQLRVTEHVYNTKNRKSKNSNNKSGHRNVSWNGSGWSVQIQIEGKNTTLKRFKRHQLEEAGVYAKKMREKYYGEFAGES